MLHFLLAIPTIISVTMQWYLSWWWAVMQVPWSGIVQWPGPDYHYSTLQTGTTELENRAFLEPVTLPTVFLLTPPAGWLHRTEARLAGGRYDARVRVLLLLTVLTVLVTGLFWPVTVLSVECSVTFLASLQPSFSQPFGILLLFILWLPAFRLQLIHSVVHVWPVQPSGGLSIAVCCLFW